MPKKLNDYEVSITYEFEGETPEDAVRQMIEYLADKDQRHIFEVDKVDKAKPRRQFISQDEV